VLALWMVACGSEEPVAPAAEVTSASYTASESCRECHEQFYELWAASHHGTAMQPFTLEFARAELTVPGEDVRIGDQAYRFVMTREGGYVREQSTDGESLHKVVHVMGGKNVYFLLTPRERGRLQVLPVAYDVREKQWYDTTASMLRHAAAHPAEAVHWTDPLLTFNTSCWSCHVSQLSINYDLETDRYDSTWVEPGINCETCHGPGSEHVRVYREAGDDAVPADLEITSVRAMSPEQRNDTCSVCHAKGIALSPDYEPGNPYFDHFDLTGLEDPDFYPDGRDLGENYTLTLWRMSPCTKSGELDCIHCHTSSGRYRHQGDHANDACLPCHESHVKNAASHSHHEASSEGSRCVACHMSMTEFARMRRSDHSMRPPAPSLTLEHGSPNACNICHTDRDADWADNHVRAWRERDFQAPMLDRADLVVEARRRDWTRLDVMLASITADGRDEILATSLIRLLEACPDPRKVPAFVEALDGPSPLVRAAAAVGLEGHLSPEVLEPLLDALSDEFRLVRIRAASALTGIPTTSLDPETRASLAAATGELERSLRARPDTWTSHYNLGNLYERRGELDAALEEYETAVRLRNDVVPPLVNAAMLHAREGRLASAEKALRRALEIDASSAEANFNIGLLLEEQGKSIPAKSHLEAAFAADPTMAPAAYNLAVLAAAEDPRAAVDWSRKAYELRPDLSKYVQTYAFYLWQMGEIETATVALERKLERGAVSADIVRMLAQIYATQGREADLKALYARAAEDPRLPLEARRLFGRHSGIP